jgi:hypothetical protein
LFLNSQENIKTGVNAVELVTFVKLVILVEQAKRETGGKEKMPKVTKMPNLPKIEPRRPRRKKRYMIHGYKIRSQKVLLLAIG